MKYLEPFNENKDNKIVVQNKYCWLICGNKNKIINIIKKIPVHKKDLEKLIWYIKEDKNVFSGAYLFFDNGSGYSYWQFDDNEIGDQDKGKRFISENNFEFQGELKIVDDKLIMDTFLADINKYNL